MEWNGSSLSSEEATGELVDLRTWVDYNVLIIKRNDKAFDCADKNVEAP